VLSGRFFFVTCRLLPKRRILSEYEFAGLAEAIQASRKKYGFLLTAWVFLPDHWHAILFPRHPLTISEAMESIKVSSTKRLNRARGELGLLWQNRFFDRALRAVKEYQEKVEYVHGNPVTAGLVSRAEDWPWSSVQDYTGSVSGSATPSVLPIDRVLLPAEGGTRI